MYLHLAHLVDLGDTVDMKYYFSIHRDPCTINQAGLSEAISTTPETLQYTKQTDTDMAVITCGMSKTDGLTADVVMHNHVALPACCVNNRGQAEPARVIGN
jgi:hypothetical protein